MEVPSDAGYNVKRFQKDEVEKQLDRWEETVLPNGGHVRLAKAQAKATWEARQPEVDAAFEAGKKVMVDWIKEHSSNNGDFCGCLWIKRDDLREFLKFLKGLEVE